VEVQESGSSAQADGIFGAAYVGINIPPSSWVAYFDVAANWNTQGNTTSANVTAAIGLLGSAYLSLDEVTPSGSVAQTILLKDLFWTIIDTSVGTGGLRFATFHGIKSGLEVDITYVLSNVVGVLDIPGNPIVTPKSLEIIVEIKNFPYTVNSNQVRLNIGVGSIAGAAQAAGSVTYVAGSGTSSVYFGLNGNAQVNGASTPVQISEFIDANATAAFQNADLQGQVSGKFGVSAVFKIVSITFPAGASDILYDPALGTGNPPVSAAASLFSFQCVFVLVSVIMLAF